MQTSSVRPVILYLSERYPPEIGGAEIQAHQVARHLAGTHQMRVVTRRWNGYPATELMDGVAIGRIPWLGHEGTRAAALNAASMVAAAAGGPRPAVIQTFQLDRTAVAGALLAVRWRAPLILTVTGRSAIDLNAGRLRHGKVAWLARAAAAIVTVSAELRSLCLAAGLPEARLRIIPNGVDTNHFQPPSPAERSAARTRLGVDTDEFLFVWLGRLHAVKGLDCLPPVWGRVLAARPKARLLVVGEGDEWAAVDALTAAWPGSVRHLPFQQDVRPLLHAADALLMTSHAEGLACTLIESMACGLPAVVSRIPANVAVDAGREFLLTFDRASPPAIERAMLEAIDERACLPARGNVARRIAEARYSLTATAAAWANLYAELATRKQPQI